LSDWKPADWPKESLAWLVRQITDKVLHVHPGPQPRALDHTMTEDCWCSPELGSEGETTIVVHRRTDH
jgi:hypothetical protein